MSRVLPRDSRKHMYPIRLQLCHEATDLLALEEPLSELWTNREQHPKVTNEKPANLTIGTCCLIRALCSRQHKSLSNSSLLEADVL